MNDGRRHRVAGALSWPGAAPRVAVRAVRLVAMVAAGWALPATAGPLPFVGCASDGQFGPQRPPRAGATPTLPPLDAARLALYAMADGTRVVAPRGWRCFGRYGSDGSVLVVAPSALAWAQRMGAARYVGPAVVRAFMFGSTFGRFEVARVAARLFPAARGFVAEVEKEGLDGPLPRGVSADDRIARRGAWEVLYTTPAGARGMGTRGELAPRPLPVDGIAVLAADAAHDLQTVDARLPTDLRPLVAYTHPRDGTRNGRRPAARRASVVTPATGRVPSPPTRPQR